MSLSENRGTGDSSGTGDLSPELLEMLAEAQETDSFDELRSKVKEVRETLRSHNEALQLPDRAGASWILGDLDQILSARTLQRARYYTDRLVKSLIEEKTGKINDINLNRWKEYDEILTDSFWKLDRRDRTGAHNASYWGNFVPQIPQQMMARFTKAGEWVLDTFAGSGTTLIECRRQGRNGIGIDLSGDAISMVRDNLGNEGNPHGIRTETIVADSTETDFSEILSGIGVSSVQMVIMHPPYWDIIKFSDNGRDLSRAATLAEFLDGIRKCAINASKVLDRKRYLVLVIGDKYSRGEWMPLGFHAMNEVLKAGMKLKSIIVKNFDQTRGKQSNKELWRYRALAGGFYVFKHEYIFVFEKK